MLANKQLAYGVLAAGILLALFAILIDPLRGHDIHMATIQWLVFFVGLVAVAVGVYLAFLYKPPA